MKHKTTFLAALAAAAGLIGVRFAIAPTAASAPSLAQAAKLIGADMKVSVSGAGAHFREVESNEDINDIDVGGARAAGGQMRPDPASKSWEIRLSGPVEDDYDDSFTSACQSGEIVTILSVSGLDKDAVAAAGPWYVKPKSLRYAKGEAVIESITIKASYGGMPLGGATPTYPDPDTLT